MGPRSPASPLLQCESNIFSLANHKPSVGMRYRALLVLTVILVLSCFAKDVSAALTVTNVTVTMDRSTFYANESTATATAVLGYTAGPAKDIGDVSFTWFRPDWGIAAIKIDTAKDDANATSNITVDMVGTWHVNATYVNQTDQFDNVSFDVVSAGDVVVVSDMVLVVNAPYFELGETVIATSVLDYAGNVSLFVAVDFTWIDSSSAVVRSMNVVPNSTGVAIDTWGSDSLGPFLIYANYTGDAPVSRSIIFEVFPTRVRTWHNFSVVVDEVWDLAGEPYGVCENITIEAGSTLTIEAGVTVRFCEDTHMTVDGTLVSDGTLDSFVNFTAFGFFPPKGYWDGIIVNPSSGSSSSITHSRVSFASIGVLITSASPTIERSSFENTSIAAIQFDNATANAEFNSFDNIGRGISASASDIGMRFNTFSNVMMGLALIDSNATLHGDTIFNSTSFGVHAFNSSVSASQINISLSGGSAIRLQSQSHAVIESSVIENSWYGVDAFSSTFYVNESSLLMNDNAVRANDGQGDLVNTSILNSVDFDFMLEGGSLVTALNCTLNDSKVQVLPASRLTVKYFLDVHVADKGTGDPIGNAFVEILDDGSSVFSSRTPSSGRIRWIPVTDRIFDGADTSTMHNITIMIRKDGYDVEEPERTVNMSISRLEVFLATEAIQDMWEEVLDPFFLLILLIIIATVVAAAILVRRRGKEEEEPALEEKIRKPSDYTLKKGTSCLVAGEKPDLAFGIFSNAIKDGASGLCITRTYPDEVSEEYDVADAPILWLSRDSRRANISPTNLGAIILEAQRFLKKEEGRDSIVMLDGLEYLIVQNDFSKVIKFVQTLKDTISVAGSKLLIPFNLAALEESRQALLTRDLELIE